jgi:hypothetical protein
MLFFFASSAESVGEDWLRELCKVHEQWRISPFSTTEEENCYGISLGAAGPSRQFCLEHQYSISTIP